ncbi:hypothetical protein OS965_02470 [Streptomyces sp. H27-G5]|uniref:hypothetical protein n=1 Tax=Streptomyces sp. H27-G5 TaxID=2996698 RepID=UPI00226D955F|nr:hypothetical protein [Streptomyces sp. H27-G5]MCY0917041.1 hypothetical protein [Streptomyces sp. H27-G5]
MPELTEPERAARRKQARDKIEAALRSTAPDWQPRWNRRRTHYDLAADIALDSLGDLAAEILTDGTMLRSLEIQDGVATLSLEPATDILKIFVAGMRGVLDGYGAENYVETQMSAPSVSMDMSSGDNPTDDYTVTVQRRQNPTPHQFRQQAEARLDTALRLVLRWYETDTPDRQADPTELITSLMEAGFALPDDEA